MTIYQILMTKYQRLFTNDYQISTKDYVRIYKQIMQNKAKVKYAKIDVSSIVTSKYEKLDNWLFRQTKPKTNPIKANTNPIKAKTKPIQTQLERSANPEPVEGTNPIVQNA